MIVAVAELIWMIEPPRARITGMRAWQNWNGPRSCSAYI
jgi:hypothetical protein